MNKYVVFINGEPQYTLALSSDDDLPELPESMTAVAVNVDVPDVFYLENFGLSPAGALVERGAKPSIYHSWDWSASGWMVLASDFAKSKASAAVAIDTAAGKARKRYITTSPGQDATYTAKYAEAQKYRDAGYPADLAGYPFISAESAPNSSRSPIDTADRIIGLGDAWGSVIGPLIEGTRINGKDALASLSTPEEITTHTAAVIAALDAI